MWKWRKSKRKVKERKELWEKEEMKKWLYNCKHLNDFIFIKVINNLFTHFIKFLEWFVCGFENFINQMVKLPRHATEQPTAWPQ